MSASSGAAQGFGFGVGCVFALFLMMLVGGLITALVFAIGVGGGAKETTNETLRAQCAEGDGAACDALFQAARFGTDDAGFGFSCGNRFPPERLSGMTCAQIIGVQRCVGILCDQEE